MDSSQHDDVEQLRCLLAQHAVAVVSGEIGLGAPQLLTGLADVSAGRTVRIPCHRAEASIRRAGLEIVLAGLRSLDPEGFPAALCRDGADAAEIAEEVLHALHAARVPAGALLVIPGADEMDRESQSILGHILRRTIGGSLCIAVSVRHVTEESPFAGLPRLELRASTRDELTDLAERVSAGGISPESARTAARAAWGRPHILRLILEGMTESQRRGHLALPVPVRVGPEAASMARAIVGTLEPETESVLRRLALAPLTSFRPLQQQFFQLNEHLADLESRGVVERRGSFLLIAQELVRAAVHWSMDSAERVALHGQLAETCAQTNPQLEHWHRSFVTVDDETAPMLARDSLTLIEQGFVDAAIEFAERSISLSPAIGALGECLTRLAEALLDRGELVFAARYSRLARQSEDRAVAVGARTLGIRIAFLQSQALPTRLINSWTRAEAIESPGAVARMQLVLGQLHCERHEWAEARQLLESAQRLAGHYGPTELRLAEGLRLSLDAAHGDDRLVLERFAELAEIDAEALDPGYLLTLAEALTMTEHYEFARAALDLLAGMGTNAAAWTVQAQYLEAEIAIRAGHIGHALALTEVLTGDHDASAVRGTGIRRDRLLRLQCWHLLMSGRASDAEAKEAELVAYATKTRNDALLAELNAMQGGYLLRMGLPAEAARQLHRCDERSAGEVNPNRYRHEADLVEALARLGRREHAALVVQALRHRAERSPSRWARAALRRSEAMLASDHRSVELFRAALRTPAAQSGMFEQALTHAAFAVRLTELGSEERARDHHRMACSLFEEVGAVAYARPAGMPGAGGETPTSDYPSLEALSDEERLVVEMVRAGMRNREIAGRIFVSLRTVELRLTAVYRKLHVTSRTELISHLAAAPRLALVPS